MADNQQVATNLFAKIAKIKGALERLPKTGKNTFHNYEFATNGDVYDTVRNLLSENNVALFAEVVSWEAVPQAKGYHVILQMRFTFACGDTGQTFTCMWAGESADSADKGFNKAMTAGTKYFLLSTFLISTGEKSDDADNSSPDVSKQQNKPAPKATLSTVWNKTEQEQFWSLWNGEKKLVKDSILAALKVGKLSDFKGTLEQANAAMEMYIKKAS